MRGSLLLAVAVATSPRAAGLAQEGGQAPACGAAVALAAQQFAGRNSPVELTLRRQGSSLGITSVGYIYSFHRGPSDADLAPLAMLPHLDALAFAAGAPLSSGPRSFSPEALRRLGHLGVRTFSLGGDGGIEGGRFREVCGFPRLGELRLLGGDIRADALAALGQPPGLRRLGLWCTQLSDAAVPYICRAQGLEELDVRQNDFTDQGMAGLAALTGLRRLKADSLGPAGLSALRKLARLEELSVCWVRLPAAGADLSALRSLKSFAARSVDEGVLVRLPPGLRRLEITEWTVPRLDLGALKDIQAVSLEVEGPRAEWTTAPAVKWLHACPHLRELTIIDARDRLVPALAGLTALRVLVLEGPCPGGLGDEGIRAIGALRGLESLSVRYSDHTDAAMAVLEGIPALARLELWSIARVTPAGLKHIWRMRRLRSFGLDISGKPLKGSEDQLLAGISSLTGLEELALQGRVTDNGLKSLAALKKLRRLDLARAKGYTYPALAALADALPELAELKFTVAARAERN
jgi:hypothetical protein